ncbi:AAA family ATPase [Hymenobacter oligotrophus]|nr:AAA family ATPase [Hymenobacter oligotrophus]
MNEQLIIKNFGPIKEAAVNFKKVTVFIGPTGGGKSTLAKLVSIFRDVDFYISEYGPLDLLQFYGIESYFEKNSEIKFNRDRYGLKLKRNSVTYDKVTRQIINSYTKLTTKAFNERSKERVPSLVDSIHSAAKQAGLDNSGVDDIMNNIYPIVEQVIQDTSREMMKIIFSKMFLYTHPAYIPSERMFVSALNNSWAGLMRDDIGLPQSLLAFVNNFSQFRSSIGKLELPMFNVNYIHKDGEDLIEIKGSEKKLSLHETASGIQATAPLLVLIEYLSRNVEEVQSFIVEEPELNLYPVAQHDFIKWLVQKCCLGNNDLTITTHSPYILASCNLLMEAYKVWQQRPELEMEIDKIVPRASWINPDNFAAYYVDKEVVSIKDDRTNLIGGNHLDDVSGSISDAFRKLLRLKKQRDNA